MDLCRYLRWKGFYGGDWSTEEELLDQFTRNEVPYRCLRTCQPWGPDDGPAVPERCEGGRACFESSPVEAQVAEGGSGPNAKRCT